MKGWLRYIPLFILIVVFAIGAREGYLTMSYGVIEYSFSAADKIAKGNHEESDYLVNNAVYLNYFGKKSEAIEQVDMVCRVDSCYWLGYYARGMINIWNGERIGAIKDLLKSLELNVDCVTFKTWGGDVFNCEEGFRTLAYAYSVLYEETGDEYAGYFSVVCQETADDYSDIEKKELITPEWLSEMVMTKSFIVSDAK